MPYTYEEFAKLIRNKYPQYAGTNDTLLVNKLIEKYPGYKEYLQAEEPKKEKWYPRVQPSLEELIPREVAESVSTRTTEEEPRMVGQKTYPISKYKIPKLGEGKISQATKRELTKEEKQINQQMRIEEAVKKRKQAEEMGIPTNSGADALIQGMYDSTIGMVIEPSLFLAHKVGAFKDYPEYIEKKKITTATEPLIETVGYLAGVVATMPALVKVATSITKINPANIQRTIRLEKLKGLSKFKKTVKLGIHRSTVGALRTAMSQSDELMRGEINVGLYATNIAQSMIQHFSSVLPEEFLPMENIPQYFGQIGEGAITQYLTDVALQKEITMEEYLTGAIMDAYFARMDLKHFKDPNMKRRYDVLKKEYDNSLKEYKKLAGLNNTTPERLVEMAKKTQDMYQGLEVLKEATSAKETTPEIRETGEEKRIEGKEEEGIRVRDIKEGEEPKEVERHFPAEDDIKTKTKVGYRKDGKTGIPKALVREDNTPYLNFMGSAMTKDVDFKEWVVGGRFLYSKEGKNIDQIFEELPKDLALPFTDNNGLVDYDAVKGEVLKELNAISTDKSPMQQEWKNIEQIERDEEYRKEHPEEFKEKEPVKEMPAMDLKEGDKFEMLVGGKFEDVTVKKVDKEKDVITIENETTHKVNEWETIAFKGEVEKAKEKRKPKITEVKTEVGKQRTFETMDKLKIPEQKIKIKDTGEEGELFEKKPTEKEQMQLKPKEKAEKQPAIGTTKEWMDKNKERYINADKNTQYIIDKVLKIRKPTIDKDSDSYFVKPIKLSNKEYNIFLQNKRKNGFGTMSENLFIGIDNNGRAQHQRFAVLTVSNQVDEPVIFIKDNSQYGIAYNPRTNEIYLDYQGKLPEFASDVLQEKPAEKKPANKFIHDFNSKHDVDIVVDVFKENAKKFDNAKDYQDYIQKAGGIWSDIEARYKEDIGKDLPDNYMNYLAEQSQIEINKDVGSKKRGGSFDFEKVIDKYGKAEPKEVKKPETLIEEAKKYMTEGDIDINRLKPLTSDLTKYGGSKTKGAISIAPILNEDLLNMPIVPKNAKVGDIIVVDGNNRYYEALKRGDKTIKAQITDLYGVKEKLTDIWNKANKPTKTQREATTLDYETLDTTGKEVYRQAALSNSQGDFLKRIQEGVGLTKAENTVGSLGTFREQVQKQELAEAHKKTEMSRKIAKAEKAGKRIVTVDDDGLLHVHAGINLVESAKALRDVSLKIIEPMKLVQMKHGKDLAAELIDSYFKADYETEKIMDMKHGEQTYEEMKNEFAHLPKKDLKNFSNAYLGGNPDSDDGKKIRQRALSELPDFLKDPRLVEAQKELAKINDFYRKSIFGDDIPSIEDYFYGKFKITDKEKFDKFIHSHKGVVDSYNKKKGILSVADASAYGYELIHKNPFENLEQEARDMGFYAGHKSLSKIILGDTRYSKKTLPTSLVSVLRGTKMSNDNEFIQSARRQMGKTDKGTDKFGSALNRWYKKSGFYKKGTSFSDKVAMLRKHYFELKDLEDRGWKPIRIGGFYEGYIVEKTIADVIGSLSSTNKISRNKLLNAVRIFNRNAQSILFLGSGFHLINVSVQSVVDTRLRDVIKGYGFREIIKSFGGIKKKDKELPYYKTFRLSGGAGAQSLQAEAERTISKTLRKFDSIRYEIDKKEHKRFRAMTERILGKTVLLPPKFVKFLFGKYIPALKFYKSKYEHDVKRMQLGRELTKAENQDIIKETQNFYGMMNEALFGRSGTMTTAMRLFFLAPGFAEGNLRTIYLSYSNLAKAGKKLTKLDFKGSYEELKYGYGSRSTRNVVQMQMAMIMAATVGSLIMTGKPPKVEKWEDIQDLFKIQTNFLDKHGNPVPINLCPVGIDYNNFTFYPIAKAIGAKNPYKYFETMTEKLGSRLIGMQAGAVGVVRDMLTLATGRSVVDWDNNEIVKVDDTNPFIPIMAYEAQRFTPFAVQSWNRGKRRGIDWRVNLASALSGFRPSRNNPDSEGLKLYWKIKEYKDRQEDIYSELYKDYKNPMKIIDKYNKGVDEFVNSEDVKRHFSRQNPIMTKEEFDKRVDRLKIHPDKYLQEKVYSLTHKNQENREGIIKLLKSFDVDSYDKAYKLLIDCSKRRGLGRETSRQRANILSKIYKNEK